MNMPKMDGVGLGKRIRENKAYDNIKLVMMTSMAGSGNITRLKDLGFSAYFPKPATTSDLFHALKVLDVSEKTLQELDGLNSKNNSLKITTTAYFNNARILLVEDNIVNQEVALGVLEEFGLRVDVASDGMKAIEALEAVAVEDDYKLILMDCQMPKMDGYEATKVIRKNQSLEASCRIPIVAMTANALKGNREKCLDSGMDDYLSKPIDAYELEEKIRYWLFAERPKNHPHNRSKKVDARIERVKLNKSQEELLNGDKIELDLVWDKVSLMKRIKGNRKLALKLIELYVTELPSIIQKIQTSIDLNEISILKDLAHQLKGASLNLGATGVTAALKKLEVAVREENLEEIDSSFAQVKECSNVFLERINSKENLL